MQPLSRGRQKSPAEKEVEMAIVFGVMQPCTSRRVSRYLSQYPSYKYVQYFSLYYQTTNLNLSAISVLRKKLSNMHLKKRCQ